MASFQSNVSTYEWTLPFISIIFLIELIILIHWISKTIKKDISKGIKSGAYCTLILFLRLISFIIFELILYIFW